MRTTAVIGVFCAATVTGCGASTAPSAPAVPENQNRITISAAGVATPGELVVTPGARVLFVNNHSQRHQIAFGDSLCAHVPILSPC